MNRLDGHVCLTVVAYEPRSIYFVLGARTVLKSPLVQFHKTNAYKDQFICHCLIYTIFVRSKPSRSPPIDSTRSALINKIIVSSVLTAPLNSF